MKNLNNKSLKLKASQFLANIAPRYSTKRLKNPFFLIGCARSGTTLMKKTLSAHNEIATYPSEANNLWHPQAYPWITSSYRDILPPMWIDPQKYSEISLKLRTPAQNQQIRSSFGAYQLITGKKVFLNKSAMLAFMIPYILELFPEARFISLTRNGWAVTRSYAKKATEVNSDEVELYKNTRKSNLTQEEILKFSAESWKVQVEVIEQQKTELKLVENGKMYEVLYEEFCANPLAILNEIANFMNIDPGGFVKSSYSHIRSQNYKFKEELKEEFVQKLTPIMEPTLTKKGYI